MLRKARLEKNLSQQRLGELLGYKGGTAQVMVCLFESGARRVPRDKIEIVAKLLNLPIEKLIRRC